MAILKPIGATTKLALFKKETTEGTFIAPTQSIHAKSGMPKYTPKVTEDQSNVGEVFTTDFVKTGYEVSGAAEVNLHPYFTGDALYFTLGQSDTPTDPVTATVLIWYTGTDNYVRIRKVGTDLIAETSADNSVWAGDANFGTGGTLSLLGATVDTAAELASVIEGYTGYEATYVGSGAALSSTIPAISNTVIRFNDVDRGAFRVPFVTVSTVAKQHYIYPSNSASDDLPSFSGIGDRTTVSGTAIGWAGLKITQLSLKFPGANDLVQATINMRGKTYETGKTYTAADIPESVAFTSNNCKVWIDRMPCQFKDLTIDINNNFFIDECIGSETFSTQGRQGGTITVTGTLNYTVTTASDRVTQEIEDKMIANQPFELLVYIQSTNYADTAQSIPYSVFIRIPRVKLSDGFALPTGKERITLPISGTAIKSDYWKHIEIYMTNGTTTEY